MWQNPTDDKSTLLQAMAWCHQAPSHYLSQCWPRSVSPYGITRLQRLNSSPPSAAHMRQWTGSALVQVMALRLFGTKPFPEPMLAYCRLDSWKQISVKIKSIFHLFHSRKCIWYCHLPKWRPLCPGGDDLKSTWVITVFKTPYVTYWRYNIFPLSPQKAGPLHQNSFASSICICTSWWRNPMGVHSIFVNI